MNDTLVDLIRHGEPQGGRRYRGQGCDDPLGDKGWGQMWAAVGDACPWTRLLSSPLQRCRDFAEALGARHGLEVRIAEDFKEVGFGNWEGLSPQQVNDRYPRAIEAFYQDPLARRPEGAEDLMAFSLRVNTALQQALSENTGEKLLLVTHAGVIRAIIGQVFQAPAQSWYRINVDYAGLTRLCFGPQGGTLEFHNRSRLT